MVPHWVTSDTHLGHANILDYCPWRKTWAADIEAHDRAIIEAWRARVQPEDVVLHLGDFALATREAVAAYRRALPGRIILVLGNHDRSATAMREAGFDVVAKAHRFEVPDFGWVACRHDPAAFTVDGDRPARVLLHGHWHGDEHRDADNVDVDCRPLLRDCGVDALRSVGPAPLAAVLEKNAAA